MSKLFFKIYFGMLFDKGLYRVNLVIIIGCYSNEKQ